MGMKQTLDDDKTGNLLNCRTIVAEMREKAIDEAKEKDKKGTEEEKKKEAKIDVASDPKRTLFSTELLIKYNVPGYGKEPIANLVEAEELDR